MAALNEPAGKKTYLGGVLIWRKPHDAGVGCTHAPIVTYNGSWTGAVSGKLVSVSAFHVLGSPDAGQALIDDYITKMRPRWARQSRAGAGDPAPPHLC